MFEENADPNYQNLGYSDSAFTSVVDHITNEMLELFLEYGADVTQKGGVFNSTPLHLAAGSNKNENVIKILLAAGADPNALNKENNTPLALAIKYENKNAISILKAASSSKTLKDLAYDSAELFKAIEDKNTNLALKLIKDGTELNYIKESYGCPKRSFTLPESILSLALQCGDISLVKTLLEAGANPNFSRTWFGTIAFFDAIRTNNKEIVELFLKYKADVNYKDQDGETPLHTAITKPSMIKILLAAGANPNLVDKNRRSPLHKAYNYDSKESIEILTKVSSSENIAYSQATSKLDLQKIRDEEKRAKTPTELDVRVDLQSDFLNKGYKFVAEGTTTLQDRNSNDKNQAVKQDIYVGYEYIFIIVTNHEIKWVVTIGDDGKFTSSNKVQEGFGSEKVPNSDLTSYFFKFGFDDKSGYVYFIPHGESWADVRWVLMRKKL